MYTARAALYLSLTLSILVLAFALDRFDLLVFLFPLLTLLLITQLKPPIKPEIQITRTIRPRRSPGETDVHVRLALRNVSSGNIPYLTIIDSVPPSLELASGTNVVHTQLRKGAECVIEYTISHPPRGRHDLGPTTLVSQDALGMKEVVMEVDSHDDFLVVPSWNELGYVPLRPRRTGVWPGTVSARRSGFGGDFYSLRNYAYGDEFRRINWKATARVGQLISNDYESERVADVVLVADCQKNFVPRDRKKGVLEYTLAATLSLAISLLRQGNRVGLIVHTTERAWLPPDFGRRQLWKIMDTLAEARSGESQVPMDYVVKLVTSLILPPRSQILIVSPLLGADVPSTARELAAGGYEVLVISPRLGKSYAAMDRWEELAYDIFSLERDNCVSMLRRHCAVLDWDVESSLSRILKEGKRWKRPTSKTLLYPQL